VTSDTTPVGRTSLGVEYSGVAQLHGPLLVVRGVSGVGWDESAVIRIAGEGSGERHGIVLEVDHDLAVVQVLEGTDGLVPTAHQHPLLR
jgi:V/A-type H+-transporting ATPase subunit B